MFRIPFRRKKKVETLVPVEYAEIYEILRGLEINPLEKKPSGFIAKFKKFFKFAHAWTRKNIAAMTATTAAVVAVVIAGVAAEAAVVIAAAVGAAAVAVVIVAVAAAVVAVVIAAAVGAVGGEKSDEKLCSVFFYTFLVECILITFATLFINNFSILPPLIASLVLLGSYFVGGIEGLLGNADKKMAVTKFPKNIQDLQSFVSERAEAFVERRRERALAADSEFAKRIFELEIKREETKTLITELKLMKGNEDEEFAHPILQDLHDTEKRIQERIDEMDVGKEEILKRLRLFEAHLPVFDRIYRRISIAEKAASLSDLALRAKEENRAFLERELESLREDGLALVRAVERICLLSVREASVSQVIEEGGIIGTASVEAVKALPA